MTSESPAWWAAQVVASLGEHLRAALRNEVTKPDPAARAIGGLIEQIITGGGIFYTPRSRLVFILANPLLLIFAPCTVLREA